MSDRQPPALDYRQIFDSAPALLLLLANDGRFSIRGATDAYLRATHTVREEIIGRGLFEVFPDNPDEPGATGTANLRASLERVVAGRAPDVMAVQKYDVRRPEEAGGGFEVRYWSPVNAPVLSADGEILHILHRVEDVTALVLRAQAAESDIEARLDGEAAAREVARRKDEFIATLSHELRNPLAPLRNALTLLRGARQPTPERVAALHEMMERQVNHLVRLVDDLLEMSRISRGVLELRRGSVELGVLVRNAVETSEPLIREAGHRLEVSLPRRPVWLDGDPVRLAQILANLLNNAARFTPTGGRITIAAEVPDGEARVSVRDTGRGFAPAAAAGLFEMFAKSDQSPGLGIGLALARRLAELHGGTITAHSDGEGRGAEFVVRLPIAQTQPRLAAAPGTTPAPIARRVLVADDNRDSAETLADLLRDLGNEVRVAFDGSEAVEAARAFQPDLALLDIGMPKLNGYQAAQQIRVDAGARPVKLVALTGWGQDDDRRRAREAGFDEHLVKPAELATLQALLRRAV